MTNLLLIRPIIFCKVGCWFKLSTMSLDGYITAIASFAGSADHKQETTLVITDVVSIVLVRKSSVLSVTEIVIRRLGHMAVNIGLFY